MLIMMRIAQHNRLTLARRGIFIPEIDDHLGLMLYKKMIHSTDALYEQLWGRFSSIFEIHVNSIRQVKPSVQLDTRPHYVLTFSTLYL